MDPEAMEVKDNAASISVGMTNEFDSASRGEGLQHPWKQQQYLFPQFPHCGSLQIAAQNAARNAVLFGQLLLTDLLGAELSQMSCDGGGTNECREGGISGLAEHVHGWKKKMRLTEYTGARVGLLYRLLSFPPLLFHAVQVTGIKHAYCPRLKHAMLSNAGLIAAAVRASHSWQQLQLSVCILLNSNQAVLRFRTT
ncbi:hypothetical protein Nepgr_024217 [Nepenthes gracilis]|uniref:Uncharacterized protein n=1 Tax=Nepenthes gracilis TaxID=150966 RepID=A0AAD3T472_NEPGR|nr:hypothetical protein Nepgr_024217 [Nepenthes gracilis]